jgi:glycosyltransferase involved in cell wall biosynthesis
MINEKKLKVLFLCGREATYTRNSTMRKAIAESAEIIDISCSHKNYLVRHLIVVFRFLFNRKEYDLVFVGFAGHLLVPFVHIFTNKPIIFDAFISIYQTLCFDRKKASAKSPIGKLAYYLDKSSCKKSAKILLDTNAHIDYFVKTFGIDRSNFVRVFVGADENIFYPRPAVKNNKPIIFTYSAYQPLHGTEYIIEAAKILEDKADFIIVGKGMERKKIDHLITKLKPKNIKLINWVPYKELPDYIARSDICLGGHFGNTEKAKMVIAGKTFQFVAMERPTLVSDNRANRELFDDTTYFCIHGSGQSIAKTINTALQSTQNKIALQQLAEFKTKASMESVSIQMYNILYKDKRLTELTNAQSI